MTNHDQIMASSKWFLLFSFFVLLASCSAQAESLQDKILEATDQRDASASVFQRALTSTDLDLQKHALLGLGRIGDPTSSLTISNFLYAPQPILRQTAAFALAISGDDTAYGLLARRLAQEENNQVLAEILPAIGFVSAKQGDPDRIRLLLAWLEHENSQLVQAACDGLTYAWSIHRETISVPNSTQVYKLLTLSQADPAVADHCLYALTRLRTEVALFDRSQLLKTVASLSSDNHHKLMLQILAEQPDTDLLDYLKARLTSSTTASVRAEAARVIGRLGYRESMEVVYDQLLNDPASQVKIGFIDGLSNNKPDAQALEWLAHLSNDASDWVKYRALGLLYASEPDNWHKIVANAFQKEVSVTWQLMMLRLVMAVESEHKQALLKLASQSTHEGIRNAASNSDDEESELEPVVAPVAAAHLQPWISKRLSIETTKGELVIQLLPIAPYTSYHFYQLATSGFYDGVLFHRVIPNFVAQTGDPTGMGSGGPGYRIREELYPTSHLRGTVGIATIGKDTGGSQFFINLKDNLHLDRRYTIFARLVSGLDVADQIERGDRIIGIKLIR